jgi:hypothetical protein
MAGLVLDVAPGWKTYWRSPGSAGVPPVLDWAGSENLGRVEVLWPRPLVFDSFGMQTVGYAGQVVLPLRVVPDTAGEAVTLDLSLLLGVCRDICVLEEMTLSARFAPTLEGGVDMVEAALARVPGPGAAQGMTAGACRISGGGRDWRLEADLAFAAPVVDPVVLLEGPVDTWFHDTTTRTAGNTVAVAAELSLLSDAAWIERGDVRMTVLGQNIAVDIRGCSAQMN